MIGDTLYQASSSCCIKQHRMIGDTLYQTSSSCCIKHRMIGDMLYQASHPILKRNRARQVVANDFSEAAVESIRRNVAHNGVEDLVTASHGDARSARPPGLGQAIRVGRDKRFEWAVTGDDDRGKRPWRAPAVAVTPLGPTRQGPLGAPPRRRRSWTGCGGGGGGGGSWRSAITATVSPWSRWSRPQRPP